jgi:hypothetical protein
MIVVQKPKLIHLMERRNVTRRNLDRHPVQVTSSGDGDQEGSDELHTGVVLNLSDSGALVALSTEATVGNRYELYWRTAAGAVELMGTCLRIVHDKTDEDTPWRCGFELSQPEDKMSVTGVFRAL